MSLSDLEKNIYQKKPLKRNQKKLPVEESESLVPPTTAPVSYAPAEPLIKHDWKDAEDTTYDNSEGVTRFGKRAIWILGIILLLAVAVGGYFVYQSLSVKEVSFRLIASDQVKMGAPFDVLVSFRNESTRVLKDAKLAFNIPDGAVLVGKPVGQNIENRALNDIGPDSFIKETFRVMFVEGINVTKNFSAIISYNPDTLGGARFEKQESLDITVGEPVVNLSVVFPDKVLSGDLFELGLKYQNLGETELNDLELQVNYPKAFTFKSAVPEPNQLNNSWDLGSLLKGSEGIIKIKGTAIGGENASLPLEVKILANILGERYTISAQSVNLAIAASPLNLDISINGDKNIQFVKPGDKLVFRMHYLNTTDVGLENVVLKAQLVGDLYNISSLRTSGFLSSLDNTITWNVANTPELRLLASHGEGTVEFGIDVRSDFVPKRLSDKNFYLKVRGGIESPTVPSNISADKTSGFANFEIKVSGGIAIDSRGLFRDAASGILNGGTLPPKVNTPVEYTIHWVVNNYITDVTSVHLSAFLQAGINWTGKIKSNVATSPVYNSGTGEITWNIDRISASKGFLNPPVEAIFQVQAVPSTLDIGHLKPILSETSARAHDEFVGIDLVGNDGALTTDLTDDPTVTKDQGIVVK